MAHAFAFDRAPGVTTEMGVAGRGRSFDLDGRLHVSVANLSKATVSSYAGREIPDADRYGLDPNRTYQLLRDPDELAKAASTFNALPLLAQHVAVNAGDPRPELVVGASGSDAEFVDPYLTNSLVVWRQDAIDAIESGEAREISCGYRFRFDPTPGRFEGQAIDGVMRDLVGSHVALVPAGRLGPDCMIGDARPLPAWLKRAFGIE